MAMQWRHQAAAARGAELLWGNTDIKTSKNLVEPMMYEERMKYDFKNTKNWSRFIFFSFTNQ